ncbi:MAG: ABC transporter permease [Bacillaceae bacterium]
MGRKVSFYSGLLFIVGLLLLSFLYTYVLKDHIEPPPELLYNDEGKLIDKPPYPPSFTYPMGVDRLGEDVFWQVIDGAKYTIFIAFAISLLRVLSGTILGIIYGVYGWKFRFLVQPVERAFRFFPAVMLVMSLNFLGAREDYFLYYSVQLALIVCIATVPMLSMVGNEVQDYMKNDFIVASNTLGGNSFWLIRRHIVPFLRSRLSLYFVQQMIQTLFLFVQLGVFHILVGGIMMVKMDDEGTLKAASVSHEWSGMIGLGYQELMLDQWIVIGPSIAFILTIYAFNLIGRYLEEGKS